MNPFRSIGRWWKDLQEMSGRLADAKEAEAKAFRQIQAGIESGDLHAKTMRDCLDEITINVKKKDTDQLKGKQR